MNNRYYFASKGLETSEKIKIDLDILEVAENLKGIQATTSTRFCTIYRFGKHEKNKIFDILKIV